MKANPFALAHGGRLPSHPIGVYDSGIGGLTVAHAIAQLLPREPIVYLGDTAHLPYGEKSEAAIRSYARAAIDFLLHKQCKVVVIACHSASSACYAELQLPGAARAPIINVIDPMIEYIRTRYSGKSIGLIGTKQTVFSQVYARAFGSQAERGARIVALATPRLAPMIEERFSNHTIDLDTIYGYLANPILSGIDCLALACTHYPIIKEEISAFYHGRMPIIDCAEDVAGAVARLLAQESLLISSTAPPQRDFFASRRTPSFTAAVRAFFGNEIEVGETRLNATEDLRTRE